jgi:hypothetical protein
VVAVPLVLVTVLDLLRLMYFDRYVLFTMFGPGGGYQTLVPKSQARGSFLPARAPTLLPWFPRDSPALRRRTYG